MNCLSLNVGVKGLGKYMVNRKRTDSSSPLLTWI